MLKINSGYKTILLIFILIIFFFLDLMFGNVHIPFQDVFNFLAHPFTKIANSNSIILSEFRLPKALSAILIGGGLSVSGLLLQSLFKNPLADPYVLGISSGASLGVAVFVLSGGALFIEFAYLTNYSMAFFAFLGALLVTLLVISFSKKVQDSISLLLIGVMFGSLTTAVVGILQYFSRPELLQQFVIWTFGSLSGIVWNQLLIMFPIILIGVILSYILSKQLNVVLLNEKYVHSLGINIRKLRFYSIVITSFITGVSTAFAGPIAFVGMAVPHIARNVFDTSNHKILIPNSFLIGSILMLLCDLLSQLSFLPYSLPINSVTALFGAPVVIWVILKNRKMKGGN